jgi:hypothetical protein
MTPIDRFSLMLKVVLIALVSLLIYEFATVLWLERVGIDVMR